MVTIRPATAANAPVIAQVLAEGFRDDPTWAIHLPDPATRPRKLRAYYQRRVSRHPETVDVAVDEGRIVGALLWAAPRRESRPSAILRSCVRAAKRIVSRLPGGRGIAHSLAVEALRPTEPHWYLEEIVSSPQARGRGVGSALLTHRLGIIDAAAANSPDVAPGLTAAPDTREAATAASTPTLTALEATTPDSRRLYERFGFEAVGQTPTQPGQASTAMVRRSA